MGNNVWMRVDRVTRSVHLYTGLFLLPWILIYGTSALCLNHNQWFIDKLNIKPPYWETVRQVDFVPDDTFPQAPVEQANAILEMLELDGAHNIVGKPNRDQMIINRVCATGNYRITWRRPRSSITVEKQKSFSFYRLIHFLHFRGGYFQPYFVNITWAVIVDAVAVSMWLWVLSGAYLWWRRSRKLLLGMVCLVGGLLTFLSLVLLFCM
ncbi:MAG: hypothetical protein A2Z25_24660 [Planctomycetes bacterium RBG_16_55_9]|nr:MAG: hypothetical protein A2Z25_24660 [Planctomycetes bacterium RBG_16_55_9]